MKYKAGDRVLVRFDLDKDTLYNGVSVASAMVDDFAGSAVTIDGIFNINRYRIVEDSGKWTWTKDMFESIEPTAGLRYTIDKISRYGIIITLEDGTRIYHPLQGNPIQLNNSVNVKI